MCLMTLHNSLCGEFCTGIHYSPAHLLSYSLASTFCQVLLVSKDEEEAFANIKDGFLEVVGVVATITHREKLHPLLLPGRGCHFMHQVFHLPSSPTEV